MEQAPASVQLIQMATGYWVSRMVYVAAELGLADLLADGPKSAEEVAVVTGSHPRSLHRLMRSLAGMGILSQDEAGRFSVTELGAALKTNAPGAAREAIRCMAGPAQYRAWGEFPYSVQTGKTAMEKAWGAPLFEYLSTRPQEAADFSAAMVGIHGPETPAVAEAYDFSQFGTVVDVGGATGNMLVHILAKYPGPKGLLYDQAHVVSEAPKLIGQWGMTERIGIESGSFFERIPAGGDAYILSHIIHDWSEEQCLTILSNCRKAMKPESKLLIVEFVLPPGNQPHFGKLADMVMLAIPGGEERTEQEYTELLAKAGVRLDRVVPTTTPVSIVEASLV